MPAKIRTKPSLDAFLGSIEVQQQTELPVITHPISQGEPVEIPLDKIIVSTRVRKYIDHSKLQRLADSIDESGQDEPITVRPLDSGFYALVTGGRRYLASELKQKSVIRAYIRDISEQDAAAIELRSDLLREDLNDIESTEGILDFIQNETSLSRDELLGLMRRIKKIEEKKTTDNSDIPLEGYISPDIQDREKMSAVIASYKKVGKITIGSFVRSRLPLLNTPTEILEAIRGGVIDYTKALLIASVSIASKRKELLAEAIEKKLSHEEIKRRVHDLHPERSSIPRGNQPILVAVQTVQKKLKHHKLNKDVRSQITQLLDQINQLIGD